MIYLIIILGFISLNSSLIFNNLALKVDYLNKDDVILNFAYLTGNNDIYFAFLYMIEMFNQQNQELVDKLGGTINYYPLQSKKKRVPKLKHRTNSTFINDLNIVLNGTVQTVNIVNETITNDAAAFEELILEFINAIDTVANNSISLISNLTILVNSVVNDTASNTAFINNITTADVYEALAEGGSDFEMGTTNYSVGPLFCASGNWKQTFTYQIYSYPGFGLFRVKWLPDLGSIFVIELPDPINISGNSAASYVALTDYVTDIFAVESSINATIHIDFSIACEKLVLTSE